MMKLLLASANKKKIIELKTMLSDLKIDVKDISLLTVLFEVEEDQSTFEGNAVKKAKTLFDLTGEWCLADDSGLEVDELNGEPGVISARYAGEPSNDENNNRKLLEKIKSIERPKAQFRSVLALVHGNSVFTTEGIIRGCLIHELRGTNGFGYDPMFIPDGFESTFAELGSEIKNGISHRAIALMKMREILKTII